MNIESLGWVPLGVNHKPYRAPVKAGWDRPVSTKPPRIYRTQKVAETYSPVGLATEVFVKLED